MIAATKRLYDINAVEEKRRLSSKIVSAQVC